MRNRGETDQNRFALVLKVLGEECGTTDCYTEFSFDSYEAARRLYEMLEAFARFNSSQK